MKTLVQLIGMLMSMFIMACDTDPILGQSPEPPSDDISIKSRSTVYNPITDKITGNSELSRRENSIAVIFEAYELMPGHAYSLWWRVWNRPELCEIPGKCSEKDLVNVKSLQVEMMFAGNAVADSDGRIHILSHLEAGDDSGSVNYMHGWYPAGGLHDDKTFSAEVDLILRSHGPYDKDIMEDQAGSYDLGCIYPLGFLPFTEIPDKPGECGDIAIAIHAPVQQVN
ncbi:hypothetical protein E0K83_02020 [Gramella sp. BOM4]|nr:hypothetical protein [Christiangramia bathymodioli]